MRGGTPAELRVRISDDLTRQAARVKQVFLRAVLFGAAAEDRIEVDFNAVVVPLLVRDPEWKDPQIFSPQPQPASGGNGDYQVDPQQRLWRFDFAIDPRLCRLGENIVGIHFGGGTQTATAEIALEKLEVHVRYTE